MHFLWKTPWLPPILMVGMNIFVFWFYLLSEGRVKLTPVKFMILYAGTVPAAARGDVVPFTIILSMPA